MLTTDSPIQELPERKTAIEEELNLIARDLVESLGYVGAMVAAYEQGDVLPVRGIHIRYMDKIREWERQIQNISRNQNISITNPSVARVYLHQKKYKDNLSVKAAEKRANVISDDLFDLFTPIVPKIARPVVKIIQEKLEIKQVAAIPFFIEEEYVGNLFVAGENEFSEKDIQLLSVFARRAASSIRSERRRLQSDSVQKLILDMQRDIDSEEKILNRIVEGVVNDLQYAGAMIATYELGDALPSRAIYLHPSIGSQEKIKEWERRVQKVSPLGYRISITDPSIARVYLHQEKYKNNLSVQAAEMGAPVVSDELYDLFTPIAPEVSRPIVKLIQNKLNIKQVIAVPFFVGKDYVGNLFAVTQSEKFSEWEISLLQTFGQNAATGLRNARLYKQSVDRREAAQIFGRMAFSASTSIHAFRGHVGAVNMGLNLLESKTDPNERIQYLDQFLPIIKKRINQITDILDRLHTPWAVQQDSDVNINACISRALEKVWPNWELLDWVQFKDGENLPSIRTSQEMLTEAFRNLIKNARDAIDEKGGEGRIVIESLLAPDSCVQVIVGDNGVGIKPENYEKVFELRWGTKTSGLGFGLFWTKDYVEGLGGTIGFESHLGRGTAFTINLPFPQRP